VVAGGVRDYSKLQLLGCELRDLVVGAAEFEAADGLGGFVLEVDFVGEVGKHKTNKWCAYRYGSDTGCGSFNVGERDEGWHLEQV